VRIAAWLQTLMVQELVLHALQIADCVLLTALASVIHVTLDTISNQIRHAQLALLQTAQLVVRVATAQPAALDSM